jgi:hypothetical protein
MKLIPLITMLLAANAICGVEPAGGDNFTVSSYGPVLGQDILRVYRLATDYCANQGKEVATIRLDQSQRRDIPVPTRTGATLVFQCAPATRRCGMVFPEGAHGKVSADGTITMTLKDGTVIPYQHCSDAEVEREPPAP